MEDSKTLQTAGKRTVVVSLAAILFACLVLFSAPKAAYADVPINESTFPDTAFREYVVTSIASGGSTLTDQMITDTLSIDLTGLTIADLQGIEYFTDLDKLICAYIGLQRLDLSANAALTNLDCSGNPLRALDMRGNPNLTTLNCAYTWIESLDISTNAQLNHLNVANGRLESLDVSANAMVTRIYCSNNRISSLDVSANASLYLLSCANNNLYDIAGLHTGITVFDATGQTVSVPLIADPNAPGAYISTRAYPLASGASLALSGVSSYNADAQKFETVDPSDMPTFTTTIGSFAVSGTIAFELSQQQHTVTFIDWDGTTLAVMTVLHGQSATPPSDPTREGHRFAGWDADFSSVTDNLTVKALYEAVSSDSITTSENKDTVPSQTKPLAATGDSTGNALALGAFAAALALGLMAKSHAKQRRQS